MKFYLASAFVAFAAVASAQTKSPSPTKTATKSQPAPAPTEALYFTQPINQTVWTAPGTHTVAWNNRCDWVTADNKTFPIILYRGPPQQQTQVPGIGPIGTLDCSKAGTAQVTIPALPSGTDYSILCTTVDKQANGTTTEQQSWSAYINIKGVDPTTSRPPVTTATQATRTATATPTPTGSASNLQAGSALALAVVAVISSLVL